MESELDSERILPLLQTDWLGQQYHFFEEIESTNTAVLEQDRLSPLPHGTVFTTDFQSQGKGRLGRQWLAPSGTALLVSLLFKPNWLAERVSWLTMMGCLAAIEAIETVTAVSPKIKWPNDLVILKDKQWHKVGGILVEGVFDEAGLLKTAVFGMGLNVNIPQDALPQAHTPPSSLMIAQGGAIDRALLLCGLLENFERQYTAVEQGYSPIPQWADKLITIGQPVQVNTVANQQTLHGIAEGVDQNGHLLVRDSNQQLHTVQAGDVTLRTNFDI